MQTHPAHVLTLERDLRDLPHDTALLHAERDLRTAEKAYQDLITL